MDIVIVAMGCIISALAALACRRWLKQNHPDVIWIAYRMHGIQPLSRPNCYRSIHRNAFISHEEVRAVERRALAVVQYVVTPVISFVPLVASLIIAA